MRKKQNEDIKWFQALTSQQVVIFVVFLQFTFFLLNYVDKNQAMNSLKQIRNYIEIYNQDYMNKQLENIKNDEVLKLIQEGKTEVLKDLDYNYVVYKKDVLIYGNDTFSGEQPERETVNMFYHEDSFYTRQHIIQDEYDIYVVNKIEQMQIKSLQEQLGVDIIFRTNNGFIVSTTEEYNEEIFKNIEQTDENYLKLKYNDKTYTYVWENFYDEKGNFVAIGVLQQLSTIYLYKMFALLQGIIIAILYIFQIFMKKNSDKSLNYFKKKIRIKTNFNLFL